jgi:hypothetical protein
VEAAAHAECEVAFAPYVGRSYDTSRLEIGFYTPVPEGWEQGDRRLICMVFDPEQEMATVSFRGSQE